MKYIKEYLCDKRTPSDEEIRECLEIVSKERGYKVMDWRDRKYYCVSFDYYSRNMRLDILKSVGNIKIHSYKNVPKQADEIKERGNYQYLLGVPKDLCDIVEYELRKAIRNDDWCEWREIERDISER